LRVALAALAVPIQSNVRRTSRSALTAPRGQDDASSMTRDLRPLVASHFTAAIDRPIPGAYDASRQLRVDPFGRPLVALGPVGETATAVKEEPPDPSEPPMWMFETETKVLSENPDDGLAMTETETRTQPEPADAGLPPTVTMPADDSVTGIVAF
jgi:hypothetical protein